MMQCKVPCMGIGYVVSRLKPSGHYMYHQFSINKFLEGQIIETIWKERKARLKFGTSVNTAWVKYANIWFNPDY
jgi:hypothetical protein